MVIKKNKVLINEEIRDNEVRLIASDGEMLGVMSSQDALKEATAKNLDLVQIAPQASPPVCKIMDYGKYLFELSKKEKEAKKNQKVVSIKELRISPSIEDHDFNFKVKNACKFLKEGDKVKITVKFRGREVHYSSLGVQILNKFFENCSDFAIMERKPKLEGRSMTMLLNPKPQ